MLAARGRSLQALAARWPGSAPSTKVRSSSDEVVSPVALRAHALSIGSSAALIRGLDVLPASRLGDPEALAVLVGRRWFAAGKRGRKQASPESPVAVVLEERGPMHPQELAHALKLGPDEPVEASQLSEADLVALLRANSPRARNAGRTAPSPLVGPLGDPQAAGLRVATEVAAGLGATLGGPGAAAGAEGGAVAGTGKKRGRPRGSGKARQVDELMAKLRADQQRATEAASAGGAGAQGVEGAAIHASLTALAADREAAAGELAAGAGDIEDLMGPAAVLTARSSVGGALQAAAAAGEHSPAAARALGSAAAAATAFPTSLVESRAALGADDAQTGADAGASVFEEEADAEGDEQAAAGAGREGTTQTPPKKRGRGRPRLPENSGVRRPKHAKGTRAGSQDEAVVAALEAAELAAGGLPSGRRTVLMLRTLYRRFHGAYPQLYFAPDAAPEASAEAQTYFSVARFLLSLGASLRSVVTVAYCAPRLFSAPVGKPLLAKVEVLTTLGCSADTMCAIFARNAGALTLPLPALLARIKVMLAIGLQPRELPLQLAHFPWLRANQGALAARMLTLVRHGISLQFLRTSPHMVNSVLSCKPENLERGLQVLRALGVSREEMPRVFAATAMAVVRGPRAADVLLPLLARALHLPLSTALELMRQWPLLLTAQPSTVHLAVRRLLELGLSSPDVLAVIRSRFIGFFVPLQRVERRIRALAAAVNVPVDEEDIAAVTASAEEAGAAGLSRMLQARPLHGIDPGVASGAGRWAPLESYSPVSYAESSERAGGLAPSEASGEAAVVGATTSAAAARIVFPVLPFVPARPMAQALPLSALLHRRPKLLSFDLERTLYPKMALLHTFASTWCAAQNASRDDSLPLAAPESAGGRGALDHRHRLWLLEYVRTPAPALLEASIEASLASSRSPYGFLNRIPGAPHTLAASYIATDPQHLTTAAATVLLPKFASLLLDTHAAVNGAADCLPRPLRGFAQVADTLLRAGCGRQFDSARDPSVTKDEFEGGEVPELSATPNSGLLKLVPFEIESILFHAAASGAGHKVGRRKIDLTGNEQSEPEHQSVLETNPEPSESGESMFTVLSRQPPPTDEKLAEIIREAASAARAGAAAAGVRLADLADVVNAAVDAIDLALDEIASEDAPFSAVRLAEQRSANLVASFVFGSLSSQGFRPNIAQQAAAAAAAAFFHASASYLTAESDSISQRRLRAVAGAVPRSTDSLLPPDPTPVCPIAIMTASVAQKQGLSQDTIIRVPGPPRRLAASIAALIPDGQERERLSSDRTLAAAVEFCREGRQPHMLSSADQSPASGESLAIVLSGSALPRAVRIGAVGARSGTVSLQHALTADRWFAEVIEPWFESASTLRSDVPPDLRRHVDRHLSLFGIHLQAKDEAPAFGGPAGLGTVESESKAASAGSDDFSDVLAEYEVDPIELDVALEAAADQMPDLESESTDVDASSHIPGGAVTNGRGGAFVHILAFPELFAPVLAAMDFLPQFEGSNQQTDIPSSDWLFAAKFRPFARFRALDSALAFREDASITRSRLRAAVVANDCRPISERERVDSWDLPPPMTAVTRDVRYYCNATTTARASALLLLQRDIRAVAALMERHRRRNTPLDPGTTLQPASLLPSGEGESRLPQFGLAQQPGRRGWHKKK